jgi:nucleolar protein 53
MDPSEYRSGSSILDVSEAVKGSGNHDPWQELPDKRREQDGFEPPEKPKVQVRLSYLVSS